MLRLHNRPAVNEAENIDLAPADEGRACLIPVRAQPGAKRSGICGVWNGYLKVAVCAPPEKGRANADVLAIIAALFGLRAGALELVSGHRSRLKKVLIGTDPESVRRRLSRALSAL